VTDLVLALPILLFSVVVHEYAHAWTAFRQGDDTAYALGRLTLNPVPHIDPVMSVIFPIGLYLMTSASGHPFTFGAARPVPIDPRKFRHYRRGDVIVSSAGIVANLLLGALCGALFALVGFVGVAAPALEGVMGTLQRMFVFGVTLNFTLAFFNLVPIPPLDGSHLLYHVLPPAWGARYRRLGRFGFVVIFALFLVPGLWDVVLWPVDALSVGVLSLVRGVALPAVLR
jgi:Zn-dependent protease